MDSRERFSQTVSHREPDRIPVDYWATKEITEKLMKRYGFSSFEELLIHFDVDFRYIEGPKYIGPEFTTREDGSIEDHWGVPRFKIEVGKDDKRGEYSEVIDFPLEKASSIDEIRNYAKWPDIEWFDFDCVRKQVVEARKTGKVVVFMGDRMNRCAQLKPAMYLRGVEQILVDLILNPDIAEYIFGKVADFYLDYSRKTFEAAGDGIDLMFLGDDFGTQNGMFMSADMWRHFLRPGFKAFIDIAKRYGYSVAHHTCGSVKPLIPDFIECGLDILNPVQPDVHDMDHAELKKLYGRDICFHGSISIQRNLPFGTPEDVKNEVRERFATLGPGGGFISSTAHNIQADTPLENVEALFEGYKQFGNYS